MADQTKSNDIQTDARPMVKVTSTSSSFAIPQDGVGIAAKKSIGLDLFKFQKIFERSDLRTSEVEYPRPGSEAGLVLIFNQENFRDGPDRPGSRIDVHEIVTAFQRLKYNVDEKNIMINGTTKQIKDKLKEVSEMDLSQQNSLVLFFMTHGRERDELLTFDGSITTYDVWKEFINCKHLDGKPKMFIFQACKGDGFSTITKTPASSERTKVVPEHTFNQTYLGPDMLVVYSTVEGNVSFRSSMLGTWFIQEFCRNSSSYGRRDDVVNVVLRTTKCLSYNYYHEEIGISKKQLPVFMSTLTKKFYYNSNKDRASVLSYEAYYKQLLEKVNNMKELVDNHSYKRSDIDCLRD